MCFFMLEMLTIINYKLFFYCELSIHSVKANAFNFIFCFGFFVLIIFFVWFSSLVLKFFLFNYHTLMTRILGLTG